VPSFDVSRWESRASIRFQKALDSGKPTAASAFTRDIHNIAQLVKLIDWCTSKKLSVNFVRHSGGTYDSAARKFVISGRLSPERQLHVLLHECGHYLIGTPAPESRFGRGYQQATDPTVNRSIGFRVEIIDEELEAWARGLKLARRKNISVDVSRFNQTKVEYIQTYLKWALRVDGYGGSLTDKEKIDAD
jgi:hypothetical protein